VIEQKFGFNTMTRRIFFADKAKGWLIGALLGGALLAVIFLLFQQWRELFWIYSWVLIAGVSLFFTMFYSEWIVPLFNKQTPLAPGELKDAINDFAKKVGFEISNIYVIDGSKRSTKANAYFTGFGKKKRVVLYDTLIKELTTEQIVAVLAHEIGHYKHNHTHIGFLLSLANTFILLYVFSLVVDSELLAKAMGGKFPTFELGLIAFTLLYSPIELILGIALNAISRKHEYQADRFAAANGLGEALIDGLKKISVSSLSNLTPSKAYVFVYYSHPTLLQRIDSIKKWQSNNIKNVIDTNINIQ
jgi:Zn-dependent protease with chaperone function